MSYEERINAALDKLPDHIALLVAQDVNKRITDWLSGDGHKADDPYVWQQVRFAENAVRIYQKGETN